jgi:hypothetical protein
MKALWRTQKAYTQAAHEPGQEYNMLMGAWFHRASRVFYAWCETPHALLVISD